MTPFQCVGFPIPKGGGFDRATREVLDRVAPEARRLPCPAGYESWSYRDPSGAGLLARFSKDAATGALTPLCVKPAFYGGSRQAVRAGAMIEDDCPFCDIVRAEVLGEGGAAPYPLVVRVSDPNFQRFSWAEGKTGRLQITLFVYAIEPGKEGAGGGGADPARADFSIAPIGTRKGRPRPRAAFSGRVVQAEKRRNAIGGGAFVWARVASVAAEYDAAVPAALLPGPPAPGSILRGSARVYARWFRK